MPVAYPTDISRDHGAGGSSPRPSRSTGKDTGADTSRPFSGDALIKGIMIIAPVQKAIHRRRAASSLVMAKPRQKLHQIDTQGRSASAHASLAMKNQIGRIADLHNEGTGILHLTGRPVRQIDPIEIETGSDPVHEMPEQIRALKSGPAVNTARPTVAEFVPRCQITHRGHHARLKPAQEAYFPGEGPLGYLPPENRLPRL